MPGVRSLSTGTGIGKPVIRGLTSNRVLVVADGQRLETQQWGDEHSPNVDTGDAERIEVIRGPASVLYGSDALGGVVNVVPKELPDAIGRDGFVRGDVTTAYSTNNQQPDGTLALEGASGGFGFRGLSSPAAPATTFGPRSARSSTAETSRSAGPARWVITRHWGNVNASYSHRDEKLEIHEDPAEDPSATPLQRIGEDRAKIGMTIPTGATRDWKLMPGYERNRRREFEARPTHRCGARAPLQHLDRQPPLPSCADRPLGWRDGAFRASPQLRQVRRRDADPQHHAPGPAGSTSSSRRTTAGGTSPPADATTIASSTPMPTPSWGHRRRNGPTAPSPATRGCSITSPSRWRWC